MKLALISNVLPPSETAHAAIINRLLRDVDPREYCLISSHDYSKDQSPHYTERLPGRYYHLPPPIQINRGHRFGLRFLRERLNLLLATLHHTRHIVRILKHERCDRVVVCTGGREIFDFPAGYLASRLVGSRFYAYLLDQYSHMVSFVLGNSFLQRFESTVLRKAAAVMVPNEFLRDEILQRYGVDAQIIRNACDISVYKYAPSQTPAASTDRAIVYTGGIGPLHADSFRNLIIAMDSLNSDMTLHIYAPQTESELETQGVSGPFVRLHSHVPINEIPAIHQAADVLFLPLAFRSPFPDIIRTAAPGKMSEYLAAGRPILVHAPADSFLAWYFREHQCGLVIDEDDPVALAAGLARILDDPTHSAELGTRARKQAESDFDHTQAQAQFARLLSLNLPNDTPA